MFLFVDCPALRCKCYSVVYPSTRLHGVTSQKRFVISVLKSVSLFFLTYTWRNIFYFMIISSFQGGCFPDNCFWVFTVCRDEMFWYFADNFYLGFYTVWGWNVLIFCRELLSWFLHCVGMKGSDIFQIIVILVFTLCGYEMFWYFAENCYLGFYTVWGWKVLIFFR